MGTPNESSRVNDISEELPPLPCEVQSGFCSWNREGRCTCCWFLFGKVTKNNPPWKRNTKAITPTILHPSNCMLLWLFFLVITCFPRFSSFFGCCSHFSLPNFPPPPRFFSRKHLGRSMGSKSCNLWQKTARPWKSLRGFFRDSLLKITTWNLKSLLNLVQQQGYWFFDPSTWQKSTTSQV